MEATQKNGTIITFYSYKGGTGRSMALANIACLIAREQKKKVLVIDWDLEAPGLHRFFTEQIDTPENKNHLGLIELFISLDELFKSDKQFYKTLEKDLKWELLYEQIDFDKFVIRNVQPGVDLIKAGSLDNEYASKATSFDWNDFFENYGLCIKLLQEIISNNYDYCLIDSRTGLTDTSGICTAVLPEKLVLVFTPNKQSLYGVLEVAEKTINYRQSSDDLRPLALFPLPSRVDDSEDELRKQWRDEYQFEFENLFEKCYELDKCDLSNYFDEVKLPHKSFYSYGEKLAVNNERDESLSLHRAYREFYKFIANLDQAWSEPIKAESSMHELIKAESSVNEFYPLKKVDFNLISHYITKEESFGPIDSSDLKAKETSLFNLLIEKQNQNYKNLNNRPSIIMGRRGSGKTSALRTVFINNQYDYYIEISTVNVLELVSNMIQRSGNKALFTEVVAQLWEELLWVCILSEISKPPISLIRDLTFVNKFLEMAGINRGDAIDVVLLRFMRMFEDCLKTNSNNGVSELMRRLDEMNLNRARTSVTTSLTESNKKLVILMDSLEDFQFHEESIGLALQGLIKFTGSMNNPRDVVDIRLCLPAEMAREIFKISSNPNKDFRRVIRLEWTATDLILIGAQRLMYFLGLYYPNLLERKSPFDPLNRSSALDLFKMVLPDKIKNQNGFEENTITYILRHTQLLPRHFLIALNSIFRSTDNEQSLNPFPIKMERIISGVRQIEGSIVKELFSAFRAIYPAAEEICRRCLPQLGYVFSQGQLHTVFTRHGKAVFEGGEFFDFQQMLIEIGAVGRVIPGNQSDPYIKGEFKYTVGHDLTINYEDSLCLHPLFSGIYSSDGNKEERPVYPYASGLDDQD